MEKKEASVNTVVKSIITGFASYGIIFYVFVILLLVIAGKMTAGATNLKTETTRIVLSVVLAVFCFVLVRFTCRVSTMDVFKKCIMNPESYGRVTKKMTLFYLICIGMAMFTGLSLLNLNLKYERAEIAYYKVYNSQVFSPEYVDSKEKEMNQQYDHNKANIVKTTVIVELGIVLGFLSLINYQGKMLERYNEYEKAEKADTQTGAPEEEILTGNVEEAENVGKTENTENTENTASVPVEEIHEQGNNEENSTPDNNS